MPRVWLVLLGLVHRRCSGAAAGLTPLLLALQVPAEHHLWAGRHGWPHRSHGSGQLHPDLPVAAAVTGLGCPWLAKGRSEQGRESPHRPGLRPGSAEEAAHRCRCHGGAECSGELEERAGLCRVCACRRARGTGAPHGGDPTGCECFFSAAPTLNADAASMSAVGRETAGSLPCSRVPWLGAAQAWSPWGSQEQHGAPGAPWGSCSPCPPHLLSSPQLFSGVCHCWGDAPAPNLLPVSSVCCLAGGELSHSALPPPSWAGLGTGRQLRIYPARRRRSGNKVPGSLSWRKPWAGIVSELQLSWLFLPSWSHLRPDAGLGAVCGSHLAQPRVRGWREKELQERRGTVGSGAEPALDGVSASASFSWGFVGGGMLARLQPCHGACCPCAMGHAVPIPPPPGWGRGVPAAARRLGVQRGLSTRCGAGAA